MRGMVDDIVDAGHGVNDGEDFDFDRNDYDKQSDHYSIDC